MKHFTTLIFAWILTLSLNAQVVQNEKLAAKFEQHVAVLSSDSMEGRGLGTAGKILAQNYIAGQFKEIGLMPYNDEGYFEQINLRAGLVWVSGANVIGYLEGSDPVLKDEYIVIGAHYDHLGYSLKKGEKIIYKGADDNASGVATMVELARYFSSNPQLVKRGIIFIAFDAEESGLLGSNKFINENKLVEISAIRTMFSLDMVGMYSANHGLDLKGLGSLNVGENISRSIAVSQGLQLKNTSASIEAATDTWHFGEKGIPAIHAFTGTKSPYHKPGDTYEKLDYEGMAKIFAFMQSLITEIDTITNLGSSKRFVKLQKPNAIKFNIGATTGFGSSHHKYNEDFYNAKGVFALNAGFFLQMHIGSKITLQPEVLFQNDGSKSDQGTFSRQSILVPVNLHYNLISENGGMAKLYPLAGGYFMHSFAGKNGGKKLDFDKVYHDQEWGLNLGLGVDIMKWQLKYTWQRSLTNIMQNPGNEIFPTANLISVGRKF